ncbi:transcriptional regulator with XRE-family HTH domain [Azospirillum brasilense]|nr:transcriptional regulator with XRE-family HTH domain [Azospirillum brasilense]TWB80528.1 transcriptional regulator with XRE-family HTH domain [Azospirillum brasilense]
MRRTLLGMSQERLGEAIGLTFQQVQKYERGSNRISAGTLYRLGQVLDVPVSFFFDCYDDPQAPVGKTTAPDNTRLSDSSISRREARMLRLWRAAPEGVGDELLSLLSCLSPHLHDTREEDDGRPTDAASSAAIPTMAFAREGIILTAPVSPKTVPAVPVGKAILKATVKPRAKAETATGGKRRRHGAVWDPADIYRAGKAPTGKPSKAPT